MEPDTLYGIMLSVLSGEADEDERRLLREWLGQSDENKRLFEQVGKMYRRWTAKPEPACGDFDVEAAWKRVGGQTVGKRRRLAVRRWLACAAAVAVLLVSGYYLMGLFPVPAAMPGGGGPLAFDQPVLLLEGGEQIPLAQDSFQMRQGNMLVRNDRGNRLSYQAAGKKVEEGKIQWNRLIVPKGNVYGLELADGTRVWLNAETELSYPASFAGGVREVRLKGEAFFKVARNPQQPFRVRTEGVDVQVLGTAFNVSAYGTEQTEQVTLVNGSVAVQAHGGERFRIEPSQQFCYDRRGGQSDIRVVDTELYTSWMENKYIFRNAPLEEIFAKLSHWYDFSVCYHDSLLRGERFSLNVDRSIGLEELMELVSFTSDVRLTVDRNTNTIDVKQLKEKEVR